MTTATPVILELGKSYTFNTLAPAILGTQIKNAKLLSIMDYSTAVAYDNIDLKFRQIYPNLPNGTPDDVSAAFYYRFLSESGERIILADQWIDMTTVESITHINIKVNFTQASLADISRIRDALNALGYRNFVISQT